MRSHRDFVFTELLSYTGFLVCNRYKKIRYKVNFMQQTACLVVNSIKVYKTLLPSLIARRWVGPQT